MSVAGRGKITGMWTDEEESLLDVMAFRAAELRMVAGLLENDGQQDRADEARMKALEMDPPRGNC